MNLWRLEWLRLARTRRWLALGGVFVFFGLLGPITARYLGDILGLAGGELEGATIDLPPPTPADGMSQYASNAFQVGTLVAVVVAAGSLAIDAIAEMGIFLRTRVRTVGRILTPRLAVTTIAVVAAFIVGGLVAWYETSVLIGPPDTTGVLVGLGLGSLFLVFSLAVVSAVAGWATSVLATVMTSILVLLVLPILGVVDAIGRWLPSNLTGALGELAAGSATSADYLPAACTTVLASAALVFLGVRLAGRREL